MTLEYMTYSDGNDSDFGKVTLEYTTYIHSVYLSFIDYISVKVVMVIMSSTGSATYRL